MKKNREHLLVLALLALSLTIFASIGVTQAFEDTPVIIIKADGTVEPATAAISQSGNTYTLKGDITNCNLYIQKSDSIFDGTSHTAYGEITLQGNNVTIKNTQVYSGGLGIVVNGSHCVIENNYFMHNLADISTTGEYTTIKNNTVLSGAYCVFYIGSNNNIATGNYLKGIEVSGSNNIVSDNTLDYLSQGGENNTYQNNILNAYKTITPTPTPPTTPTAQPTATSTQTNTPQPTANVTTNSPLIIVIAVTALGACAIAVWFIRSRKHPR